MHILKTIALAAYMSSFHPLPSSNISDDSAWASPNTVSEDSAWNQLQHNRTDYYYWDSTGIGTR